MAKKMHTSNPKGFTLIEVMITVVIVGILASVALSSYSDNVMKSKRTDARNTLLTTSTSLEKCRALYGTYNNANCSIQNGTAANSPDGLYSIAVASTATTFTLTATPITGTSQASDTDCQSITLNNLGQQLPVICW